MKSESIFIVSSGTFVTLFNNISRVLYNCIVKENFSATRWQITDRNVIDDIGYRYNIAEHISYMFFIPANTYYANDCNIVVECSVDHYIIFVDDTDDYECITNTTYHRPLFTDSHGELITVLPSKLITYDFDDGDFYKEIDYARAMFGDMIKVLLANNVSKKSEFIVRNLSDYLARLLFDTDAQPDPVILDILNNYDVTSADNFVRIDSSKIVTFEKALRKILESYYK